MLPADFIQKWKDNKLSERAGAQAHFLDLCELLGVEKPSDPDHYCFERGAKRTGAGRGWADVWKRHCFAWEYKAPGANLDTPAMPDEEILRRLLKLNLERAAATR